jgi:putative transposase
MPRKPRLFIAGYPYHVTIRGNNKNDVFYSDSDRRFFLSCLKEAKELTGSKLYAYCLMTNHIHLVLEPSLANGVSLMIQNLGRKYVRYVNAKHNRTGTLWEGRFKSSLIDKDAHLLACLRYVEVNPVRAGIVKHPEDYPWSSFCERMGSVTALGLIDFDEVFLGLGDTLDLSLKKYHKFVLEGVADEELRGIRVCTEGGGIIGPEDFVGEISRFVGRNLQIKKKGRPRKNESDPFMKIRIAGFCAAFLTEDRVFERAIRARYRRFAAGGKEEFRIRTVALKMKKEPFTPVITELGGWAILERGDFRCLLGRETGSGVLFIAPSVQSFDSFLRTFYSRLLLCEGGMLLHCAGLVKNGKAYLFLGRSGAGKSTLSKLAWAAGTEVISDELNLVRFEKGRFIVYGSPFWGEMRNEGRGGEWPLAKIFILKKAKGRHRVSGSASGEALAALLSCLMTFSKSPETAGIVMANAARLLGRVEFQKLEFSKKNSAFLDLI